MRSNLAEIESMLDPHVRVDFFGSSGREGAEETDGESPFARPVSPFRLGSGAGTDLYVFFTLCGERKRGREGEREREGEGEGEGEGKREKEEGTREMEEG